MADNTLLISQAIPLQFYEMDTLEVPQYMSRHMDDYLYALRIRDYEYVAPYRQKWGTHDSIPMQFQSNFSSIQLQIIDCSGHVYRTVNATKKLANKDLPGYFAYEVTLSWAGLDPGVYWVKMALGSTLMISEPQELLESPVNTLLFEYNDSRYHGDLLPTGITFNFRVEAILDNFDPGQNRVFYRDQEYNPTTLSAIPFRSWDLVIGFQYGVPDWVANKINWILSFNNLKIDGKQYAILEDSKMEPVIYDQSYPLRRYTIKVQEGYNRASKNVGASVDSNSRILTSIVLDSTIFGPTENPGNDLIIITDVN